MNNVLVFKTSVTNSREVRKLEPLLNQLIQPHGRWNFDLEDCDRILRVEANAKVSQAVTALMNAYNYQCHELH